MSMPVGTVPFVGSVHENRKSFSCSRWKEGCPFTIWKKIAGRFINRQEAQKLITTGRTDKLYGFKSRKGKKFSAYLVLQERRKVEFEFSTRKLPPVFPNTLRSFGNQDVDVKKSIIIVRN